MRRPIKRDWVTKKVYLYEFPRSPTVPNISPFCLKLESWLIMAAIDYEAVGSITVRSKEGTLPFVEMNGQEIDDSSFAIDRLTKEFDIQIENDLHPEQKAISRLIEQTCDNSLLITTLYAKIAEKTDEFFGPKVAGFQLPAIYKLLKPLIRKQTISRVKQHGIGRHSREEIMKIGKNDIKALSDLLGAHNYFFGQKPHRADACAFAHLANIVYLEMDIPHKQYILERCPNLIQFCDRFKNEVWGSKWNECHKGGTKTPT